MHFTLDDNYMCDVSDTNTYSMFKGRDPDSLTPDELMKILKGQDKIISYGTKDHPEFTRFREQLGVEGYIEIQRSWVNGDRVIKPFTLNDVEFEIGDKFCCAGAMKGHLKFVKKYIRV